MKPLPLFFLPLIFSFSLTSFCQTSADLTQKLESIQSQLQEVSTGNDTYIQELNFEAEKPFLLRFMLRTIDKKGRETVEEFNFNLGLFDENLVRWSSNRDQMRVILKSGNQPAVQYIEDGELVGYENEVTVHCTDIDNARAIEQLFKEAVPMAQVLWKNAINLPKDLGGLLSWLGEHIANVSVDEETIKQNWTADESSEHRTIFELEVNDGKNTEIHTYKFSLSDILEESLETKIQKNKVTVELGTRQKKNFIREETEGLLTGYLNQLSLYANDPDEAQEIIFALKEAIPLARVKADEEYAVGFSNITEGLNAVKAGVVNFNDGETLYEQSITADCQTEYQLKATEDSKTEENNFALNFSDIDPQAIEIDVKRTKVSVYLRTDNRLDFIRHVQDGELQNYDNDFNIPVENIPTAKRLVNQLRYLAGQCTDEVSVHDLDWLAQTLGETSIPELTQQLEKQEDACKLSFTATKDDGKKVKSELYEFNLYDLSADNLSLQIKGKQVLVNLETKSKEKIINNYTDGEKLSYVSDFDMEFNDIPTAKNVVFTLKEMIKKCRQ